MVSLPKLVKERLRAQRAAGQHPDPDQMTALIERSLPQAERTRVLQHVAACADCREIIFLALPETGNEQLVAKASSGWMQWPVLRWGAVAACCLVVGAAVTLHLGSPHSQNMAPMVARVGSDADSFTQKEIATGSNSVSVAPQDEKAEAKQNEEIEAKIRRDPNASVRPSVSHFAEQRTPLADMQSVPAQSAPTAAPAPAPMPEASGTRSSAAVDKTEPSHLNEDRRLEKRDEVVSSGEDKPSTESSLATTEPAIGKAKEPLKKSELAEGKASFAKDQQIAGPAGGLVLAPRWTLSADGTLQRSFNAGKTWETIPVTNDAKLRALAAIGTEIWVGGSAGALYHSSDAGRAWTQVKPTAPGRSLTGDIIAVEFTDTQHGKLTVANGEGWTTADGGQSWSIK
jgi:hypothetical protein